MKRASATVIFDSRTYKLINLTINYRGTLIKLVYYDSQTIKRAINYSNFHELYKYILAMAKANNFEFSSYRNFGLTWYNIQFLDIYKHPYTFEEYGFKREGEN